MCCSWEGRDDVHRNARRRRRIRTGSNPTSTMNKHMNFISGMAENYFNKIEKLQYISILLRRVWVMQVNKLIAKRWMSSP